MTAFPLKDRFWVHVGPRQPENLGQLTQMAGGLVAQPHAGNQGESIGRVRALGVPFLLQHRGVIESRQMSLLDPDEDWIMAQETAAILTSRTLWLPPGEGSDDQLRAAVTSAIGFSATAASLRPDRPRMVLLALSTKRLTNLTSRSALITSLASIGEPIGVMLGSEMDPLDNERTVEGVVELVQTVPNVVLIRCDHGALGAYAFGAIGGSIGVTPSTRHYVPPGLRAYANLDDPTPRVFWPSMLEWWRGSRLGYLEQDELSKCNPCGVCRGQSLSRFQDEALEMEAAAHSVESWLAIAERLVTTEPSERADAWIEMCSHAYKRHEDLEDRHDGLPHPLSKQLKAWLRFAGIRAV